MKVKKTFSNDYMTQPEGFVVKVKEHRGYYQKYGLEHVSRQWHLKLRESIVVLG